MLAIAGGIILAFVALAALASWAEDSANWGVLRSDQQKAWDRETEKRP